MVIPRDLAAQYEALSSSATERTSIEAWAIQCGWAICQKRTRTTFRRDRQSLITWWDERRNPQKSAWLRTELRKALAGHAIAEAVEEVQ